VEPPVCMYLLCPACQHPKDIARTKLFNNGKWSSIACLNRACRTMATSRKWNCLCNCLWHSCQVHASKGHACTPLPKRVRPVDNDDPDSTSKRPRIEEEPPDSLPPRPSRRNRCLLNPDGTIRPLTAPGERIRARFPRIFDG
jgi:hypothetical protein